MTSHETGSMQDSLMGGALWGMLGGVAALYLLAEPLSYITRAGSSIDAAAALAATLIALLSASTLQRWPALTSLGLLFFILHG